MTAKLIFHGATIAPGAFEARVARAMTGFAQLGIGDGDVVCVMLRNGPTFLEAALAPRRLGAYSCPINWHYRAEEAGWILRDSGAKALVVHADLLPAVADGIPPGVRVLVAEPDAAICAAYGIDAAQARVPAGATDWDRWVETHEPFSGPLPTPRTSMPYTSGTTGRAKGVRRALPTPEQQERARDAIARGFGVTEGMRGLVSGPLYHSAPNLYASQAVPVGELLVLEAKFDAERTLALIDEHRLTSAYLVPTMYVRMLRLPEPVRRRYDVSSMRFVASTGSPCPPEVKRAMIEWWGPVFYESYASSEAGLVTIASSEDALARPGTAGRALGEGALKILDAEGRELPAGEIGLIYARSPAYPDFTYNNNDEARRAIEKHNLWTLGDMGYVDADGYLYICDRASDMVISGGVNIYPAEIEAVLATMPEVRDCAVFGIPDAEFGEALCAAIEPMPDAALTPEILRGFLAARIAGYKVPRQYEFHAALPREDSGKIFKRRLRDPHWKASGRRI